VRALSSSSIASPLGTAGQRVFDLYYDRAMKNVDRRKGEWFLYRELGI
jgi:hypothetical protein